MNESVAKAVFPVGLEHGEGDVNGQNGTGFLLNFSGYKFVITALHCIPERWKISGIDGLKNYIEENIFFGIVPDTENIWRIPLNHIFYHKDDVGNFLDILICAVDIDAISEKKAENTSLNTLLCLELASHEIRKGFQYYIYGYPTSCFTKNEDFYHAKAKLIHGEVIELKRFKGDDENDLDIPNSAYPIDICEIKISGESYGCHGFSGGPVLDGASSKVVGIVFRCSSNYETFYFFPNNVIEAVLRKIVLGLGV